MACIRDPAFIGDPAAIYTSPVYLYCSVINDQVDDSASPDHLVGGRGSGENG